jgi:hypothetical protein
LPGRRHRSLLCRHAAGRGPVGTALALLTVVVTVLVAHVWLSSAPGPTMSPTVTWADSADLAQGGSGLRNSAPGTPPRVVRGAGLDWNQIIKNDRSPARAARRQPRTQNVVKLLAVVVMTCLALRPTARGGFALRLRSLTDRGTAEQFSRGPPMRSA